MSQTLNIVTHYFTNSLRRYMFQRCQTPQIWYLPWFILYTSSPWVRCQVYSVSTKCRLQTLADHCFHHGNENKTTMAPLLSNPENNGLQSVCILYFRVSYLMMTRTKVFLSFNNTCLVNRVLSSIMSWNLSK